MVCVWSHQVRLLITSTISKSILLLNVGDAVAVTQVAAPASASAPATPTPPVLKEVPHPAPQYAAAAKPASATSSTVAPVSATPLVANGVTPVRQVHQVQQLNGQLYPLLSVTQLAWLLLAMPAANQ
jgi:hypothetical protein